MTFMGYSRNSVSSSTTRMVEIISVDGSARKAIGRTREQSDVEIDCRYMVGAMMVTPAVGEAWWAERVGTVYTLKCRVPANSSELLLEGYEGQTQIGSRGPTEINGSVTNVHAGLVVDDDVVVGTDLTVGNHLILGQTNYRDDGETLQRQNPETLEWLPVSAPTYIRFTAEVASVAPTYADRCYIASRELVGAYLRVSGAPVGSDLVAEVQYASSPAAWSTLATLTVTDGTDTEASETFSLDQVEGDYLRVEFTSVGSGTPAAGVVVDILMR